VIFKSIIKNNYQVAGTYIDMRLKSKYVQHSNNVYYTFLNTKLKCFQRIKSEYSKKEHFVKIKFKKQCAVDTWKLIKLINKIHYL